MAGDLNMITWMDVADFKNAMDPRTGFNTLDKYQELATKTAIYPGVGTPLGLDYCALKLNGEAGELAEHVGKAMRDDELIMIAERQGCVATVVFSDLTPDRKDKIIKEVGDILWYLSAICNELGIKLSDAALGNLQKLNGRTERGTLTGSGDDR